MNEIPMEVLYAAELAKTFAWAQAQVACQGHTLRGVTVLGVPRDTHLAWILAIAGFEPRGGRHPLWVWQPGIRLNPAAN